MKMEMKCQDMEELYQLLKVYERTYGDIVASEMLRKLSERYKNITGETISTKRNPRDAGRKRKYTEEEKRWIRELRDTRMSIRRISEETGCSVGYVQGVLSEPLR